MLTTSLVFGLALVLSLAFTPVARKLALRTGFVSNPIARSMHTEPKPFLGGLAMFAAFAAAVLVGGDRQDVKVMGILVCGALIVLLGAVDDRVNLKPKVKMLGQVLVAALLVYRYDVVITGVFSPLGERYIRFAYYGSHLGPIITIFWIVAFMNVVNLIDGLDGLAAGICSITALTLLFVSLQQKMPSAILLTAALAGSAIGFLRYNFNPAKIFMGDAGSMFLGYTLAAISIIGPLKTTVTIGVVVPVLAMALPIFDTAFAIIRRLAAGRSPGEADKDHLHHRLLRLGLSHRKTVLVMWAISAWLGLSAILVTLVPMVQALLLTAGVLAAVVFGAMKMGLLEVTTPKQKTLGR